MKNLTQYKSFQGLTNELVYMNKCKDIYSISLGTTKVHIQMCYTDLKKYAYKFIITDSNIIKKLESTRFLMIKERLSNKSAFLNSLKKQIDIIIPILQQSNYKLSFTPEIVLFDLENIAAEYGLEDIQDKSSPRLDKERNLLNKVILFHNIFPQNIVRTPYKKNDAYIVEINSIAIKNAVLFPQEDKYFVNTEFIADGSPNLYFPSVITLKISKYLEYKDIKVKIVFESQSTIQNYAEVAREYYGYYKETKKEAALSFSTKILSIIKNPYNGENFKGEITPEDAVKMSQCPKCNSTSSMFKAVISQVDVETKMSSLSSYPLYPENIINYKDMLLIECSECKNKVFEDKAFIDRILDKRNTLKPESWHNPEDGVPLLDSQEERNVVVKYDTMNLDLEFDTTNPFQPKAVFSKITKTGKIIGWLDKKTKVYTSFY